MKLKQIFCLHWFDERPTYEYEYSAGPIICTEQRTYRATIQPRICSKCGLKEERRIGDPVCEGWS